MQRCRTMAKRRKVGHRYGASCIELLERRLYLSCQSAIRDNISMLQGDEVDNNGVATVNSDVSTSVLCDGVVISNNVRNINGLLPQLRSGDDALEIQAQLNGSDVSLQRPSARFQVGSGHDAVDIALNDLPLAGGGLRVKVDLGTEEENDTAKVELAPVREPLKVTPDKAGAEIQRIGDERNSANVNLMAHEITHVHQNTNVSQFDGIFRNVWNIEIEIQDPLASGLLDVSPKASNTAESSVDVIFPIVNQGPLDATFEVIAAGMDETRIENHLPASSQLDLSQAIVTGAIPNPPEMGKPLLIVSEDVEGVTIGVNWLVVDEAESSRSFYSTLVTEITFPALSFDFLPVFRDSTAEVDEAGPEHFHGMQYFQVVDSDLEPMNLLTEQLSKQDRPFLMPVEDVFTISGRTTRTLPAGFYNSRTDQAVEADIIGLEHEITSPRDL